MEKSPFLGLRTVIYPVEDLQAAKEWYRQAFGIDPYFDEPFYVGFNVGGYELGLNPDLSEAKPGPGGAITYWGVESCDDALARMRGLGAREQSGVQDVGGGIRVASVLDPFGNVIGLIENPHFQGGS